MSEKYRRRTFADVEAAQYLGTEESAAAVIAWARTIPHGPTIERYTYTFVPSNEVLEVWLKITDLGTTLYASAGCWIVLDGDDLAVLSPTDFEDEYELAEATA